MCINDLFMSYDFTTTKIAMRKCKKTGDLDPFEYHVAWKERSEERGINYGALQNMRTVALPDGNVGRVRFSKQWCEKHGLHNLCMKPYNKCTCMEFKGVDRKRPPPHNFFAALERNNNNI